jgi:hypothetical protein
MTVKVMRQLEKRLHAMTIAERKDLARRSGVAYHTIHKYAYRPPRFGRLDIVERLQSALGI